MQYKGMELCDFCFSPAVHGEACGVCGFTHENYKYLYNKILLPGTIILGKYVIGRVLKKDETRTAYLAYLASGERVVITEYLPSAIVQRSNGEEMVSVIPDRKSDFLDGAKAFVENADEMRSSGKDVSEAFYTNGTVYFCTRYEKSGRNNTIFEKTLDINSKTVQHEDSGEAAAAASFVNLTPAKAPEVNPSVQKTTPPIAPKKDTAAEVKEMNEQQPIQPEFPKPQMSALSSKQEEAVEVNPFTDEKTAIWEPNKSSPEINNAPKNPESKAVSGISVEEQPIQEKETANHSPVHMPPVRMATKNNNDDGILRGDITFIEVYADGMTDLGPDGSSARLIYEHEVRTVIYSIVYTNGGCDEDRLALPEYVADVRALIDFCLAKRPEWDVCFAQYMKEHGIPEQGAQEQIPESNTAAQDDLYNTVQNVSEYVDNPMNVPEHKITESIQAHRPQSSGFDLKHSVEYTSTDGDIGKSHYEPEQIMEPTLEPLSGFTQAPIYPQIDSESVAAADNADMYGDYYSSEPAKKKKKWLFPLFMIIGGVVCAALIAVIIILLIKGNDNSDGNINDNSQSYYQNGYSNTNTGNVNQANAGNNITANEPTGEIVNAPIDTDADADTVISDVTENIENIVGEALKDAVVEE